MTERPGRYQRSVAGLVGSLLVTVLAIAGFVGVRALVRTDPEYDPQEVDYLELVEQAQQADLAVVYPEQVQPGWQATSVHLLGGHNWSLAIGFLTEDDEFAGVRQEHRPIEEIVAAVVDEDALEGDEVRLSSGVAERWRTFTDAGGDRAFAADVGDTAVVVYGSARREDLVALVAELTSDPVPSSG